MTANNEMRTPTNRDVMRPNMYDQTTAGPGMVVVYGQQHDGTAEPPSIHQYQGFGAGAYMAHGGYSTHRAY